MADSGVGDFPASDLFDGSKGDSTTHSDIGPPAFRFLKTGHHELINRLGHGAETTPVFGCPQPNRGSRVPVPLSVMGEARGPKLVSHAARKGRKRMVSNLERLIAREYPNMSPTAAYEAIQEAIGISLSSMQRIMSGKTGPSIDTLSELGHHLGADLTEILADIPEVSDPFLREPLNPEGRAKRA